MVRREERGQVALIVMLMSVVALALGLSVSNRTIEETRIASDEELLGEAFNYAESGVDKYLATGGTNFGDVGGSSVVEVRDIGDSNVVDFGEFVVAGRPAQFWLVGHNADGSLNFADSYDGSTIRLVVDSDFAGAVKVDLYYRSDVTSDYGVYRWGLNMGQAGVIEGFDDMLSDRVSLNMNAVANTTPVLLVVVPFGDGTNIRLEELFGGTIPRQGEEIISTGQSRRGENEARKTVRVMRRYEVPGYFLRAVTSMSGSVLSN